MSKRLVLIRNPGNSGGNWFKNVSNLHEKILMFQEINQLLRIVYSPKTQCGDPIDIDYNVKVSKSGMFSNSVQIEIAYNFLADQYDKRSEEVVGLVKCFDTEFIKNLKVNIQVK